MQHNYIKRYLILAAAFLTLAISSCKDDDNDIEKELETVGVYMLHEGSMGKNNSGIDYYDIKTQTTTADYFKQVNGYDLGETANALQQYGNKIYCVISGIAGTQQSFLEVINPATGKSIKRIPFYSGTTAYEPRVIAFNKNKAYVAGFDGNIYRVDTASLAIDKTVAAGRYQDGIAIANGKIYTSNSAYIWGSQESTVSVVDLATFTKLKEIEVGVNPTRMKTNDNGDIFLATNLFTAPTFKKIDTKTDAVTAMYEFNAGAFSIAGNSGYITYDPYGDKKIKTFNTTTGQTGNDFITDGTTIETPYGITINSLNGDVLVADANNYGAEGVAYCFDSTGKLAFKFTTGPGPQQAVFVYK